MPVFYTRRGDNGSTGLLGKERVPKHSLRIETVGTLDELNAVLGIVRSQSSCSIVQETARTIQIKLYQLMTEIAATEENREHFQVILQADVDWLEEKIETFSAQVEIPRVFILPGDTASGAFVSLARTVARRAERRVSELFSHQELENPVILAFLNRLSSLCFVLELFENKTNSQGKQSLVK